MTSLAGRRLGGAGLAASAVICPCHVVAGALVTLTAAITGAAPGLSPALQDGVHAVYLPVAMLLGARLLTGRGARGTSSASVMHNGCLDSAVRE